MTVERSTNFEPMNMGDVLPTRPITRRRAQALAARMHHMHARQGVTVPLYEGEPWITTSTSLVTVPDVADSAPDLLSMGGMLRFSRPFHTASNMVGVTVEAYLKNAVLEIQLWRLEHQATDASLTLYSESLVATKLIEQNTVDVLWGAQSFEVPYSDTYYEDADTGARVPLMYALRLRGNRKQETTTGILYQAHAVETWYNLADAPLVHP